MTNPDFAIWVKRLFVAFPGLWDWLQSKSLDPIETQGVWRKCLGPYSLEECMTVLDEWSSGAREPFEAYERDKVHLRVRARIEQERDRARKRRELSEASSPYRSKRQERSEASTVATLLGDRKAVAAGAAEHRKFLDGEIDWDEYVSRREVILREHGFA